MQQVQQQVQRLLQAFQLAEPIRALHTEAEPVESEFSFYSETKRVQEPQNLTGYLIG